MLLLLGSFCFRIMMPLHLSPMNSGVQAPLSTRFASLTKNHSRSDLGAYPRLYWRKFTSLRDMLEAGTIQPSQSPWCNAMVLVRKKDGSLRFCVDFRRLNACTKKDSYPLPRIQEALESMAGAAHFSTMDFKSGFWQVCMAPESQQYTAFTVGNLGFYEFTRMPFGLCNVPATFQHLMQNTLGELNLTYCVIYLDDVIVYGRTEEEHLERLRIVLEHF